MHHFRQLGHMRVLDYTVRGALVICASMLIWPAFILRENDGLISILLLGVVAVLFVTAAIMPNFGSNGRDLATPTPPPALSNREKYFFGVITEGRPTLHLSPLRAADGELTAASLPPSTLGWVSAIDATIVTRQRPDDLDIAALRANTPLHAAWSPRTSLAIYRDPSGVWEGVLFVGGDTPPLDEEDPTISYRGHPDPSKLYFYFHGELNDPEHVQGFPRR